MKKIYMGLLAMCAFACARQGDDEVTGSARSA